MQSTYGARPLGTPLAGVRPGPCDLPTETALRTPLRNQPQYPRFSGCFSSRFRKVGGETAEREEHLDVHPHRDRAGRHDCDRIHLTMVPLNTPIERRFGMSVRLVPSWDADGWGACRCGRIYTNIRTCANPHVARSPSAVS